MKFGSKRKIPVWGKMLIVLGVILVMFTAAFLLKDTVLFGNYRIFLRKIGNFIVNDKQRHSDIDSRIVESDKFDLIDKDIPFRIQRPSWLPEGYELEFADYIKNDNETYIVDCKYKKNEAEEFQFTIFTEGMIAHENNFTNEPKILDVNGIQVFFVANDEYSSVEYNNMEGHLIIFSTKEILSEETIIKIIENIE